MVSLQWKKDRNLIPNSFDLGENNIKRVPHTKVLGLIIDEDLNFIEHSKAVYRNLMGKWMMIHKYTNRHWGLKQQTMIQIIKTLWLPTLLYAGHVWITKHNIKEINSLLYKIMKATIGAVFNIRQSLAEIILGLPPIFIVNETNKVKHYLKMQMSQIPEDRLKDLVDDEIRKNQPSEVRHAIRQVFKFLNWKLNVYPDSITQMDKDILQSGNIEEFCSLSPVVVTFPNVPLCSRVTSHGALSMD